jgi:hypothetical protein
MISALALTEARMRARQPHAVPPGHHAVVCTRWCVRRGKVLERTYIEKEPDLNAAVIAARQRFAEEK